MPHYTVGVDLAQRRDYSAVVVAENLMAYRQPGVPIDALLRDFDDHYRVLHAELVQRGTDYQDIVETLAELLRQFPNNRVLYDRTGVGGAVAEMFGRAYREGKFERPPRGITITAGHQPEGNRVPKMELVARLDSLFERGRVEIAGDVAARSELEKELLDFRAKVGEHGTRFEGRTDDLVNALMLACWETRWTDCGVLLQDGHVVYTREDFFPPSGQQPYSPHELV